MRSRFTGKRLLLAAAVAGASVAATTVPAQAAPPPDAQDYQVDDCAKALDVLSSFKLLPNQPDLGRTLCSIVQQQRDQKDQYSNEVHTEYTDENGKKVESDKSLGSVEWLKSLTVRVPTINDRWYVYTSRNT
ncbi:hypothetical protein GCM10010402_07880 [Actinomadura luteofluorescens]|uniref:hypothetical protein n=1 Tax=Actinomadura luteofluorescens TaxID=46163 RepID=UPI002164B7E5|nr:hypothetical protein [Actinomadura glauciflava]MCR3745718.1 hypothetical protein [Actinomadura glauciflava]